MLMIRLTRTGRKNYPSYRVIVVDKRRAAKTGSFLEIVGYKDNRTKKQDLKTDRIQYWLSKGAQPSDTVHNLLVKAKIISAPKRAVKMKKPEIKEEASSETPTETPTETPAEEVATVTA